MRSQLNPNQTWITKLPIHAPFAAASPNQSLDRQTKAPAVRATAELMEAARRNGLLIGKGGTYGNCIRISPPLNVTKSDVDEFARLLDRSLKECVNGTGS